jgi:hypothetical protein
MAISDNADNPKKASSDGVSVEQHSLKDQIEYDRYKNANDATHNRRRPHLRINQIKPPGGV